MCRKIGFFLLSLWLLFICVIILTCDIPICFSQNYSFVGFGYLVSNNTIPLCCIFFLILGCLSLCDFNHKRKGTPELSFEIIEIENINYEHLAFLTTYIIPLVSFQFDTLKHTIIFTLILIAIGWIYIRTDLFYTNPTLAILSFKIYKVKGKFRNGEYRDARILITKDRLERSDMVKYIKLDERIYYAIKTKNTYKDGQS